MNDHNEPFDDIEQLIVQCLVGTPEREWPVALERLCVEHPEEAHLLRPRVSAITRVLGLGATDYDVHRAHRGGGTDGDDVFGGYRIGALLGSGGMGVVHVAEQGATHRTVALKRIRPEFLGSARARQRFRREVELAASLDHPDICTIYEAGEVEGVPFLAMQLVEGRTLETVIADRGAIGRTDLAPTLELLARVGHALHHAHLRGLVHRDVKPSNVLCRASDGQPLVLDFGLARLADAGDGGALTVSGEVVGTPAYLAPEQIDTRRPAVDHAIDVYALGVTAYETLTGTLPYSAHTRAALFRQILEGQPVPVSKHLPFVPRDLDIVIETAMAKEPERRYATAAALADDLTRVREGRPIAARRLSAVSRAAHWARRHPLVASLLVTLAIALVMAASSSYLASVRLAQRRHSDLMAAARAAPSKEMRDWLALAAVEERHGFEEVSLIRRQLQGAQWRDRLEPRAPQGHIPVVTDAHGALWALSQEPSACRWHPERGSSFVDLPVPGEWLACSPDGRTIAVACRQHGALVFAAAPSENGPGSRAASGGPTDTRLVEFTADGRLIVLGGNCSIWIGDHDHLSPIPTPTPWDVGEPTCVTRHPVTGDVLVGTTIAKRNGSGSGLEGAVVRVPMNGEPEIVGRVPRQVWQIRCARASARFAALHGGCSVWPQRVPAAGPELLIRGDVFGTIVAADFYGEELLTGHQDARLRIWRLGGASARVARVETGPTPVETWSGHIGWVARLACDESTRRVISVDGRGLLLVWDRATGRPLTRFQTAARWSTEVGFVGESSAYVRQNEAAALAVVDLPRHASAYGHRIRGVPLVLTTDRGRAIVGTSAEYLHSFAPGQGTGAGTSLPGIAMSVAARAELVCIAIRNHIASTREIVYLDADLQPIDRVVFETGTGAHVDQFAWRSDGSVLGSVNLGQADDAAGTPTWVATRRTTDGGWERAPILDGLPSAESVTALLFVDDRTLVVGMEDRVGKYRLSESLHPPAWCEDGSLALQGQVPNSLSHAAGRVAVGTTMGAALVWSLGTGEVREIHGLQHDARLFLSDDGMRVLALSSNNIIVATADGERLYQVEPDGDDQWTVAGFLDGGESILVGGTTQALETWQFDPYRILESARRLVRVAPTPSELAAYAELLPAGLRASVPSERITERR